MGGFRDLFETLSELFGWLLKALRVLIQIIGTLLSDAFGLLFPRLFELTFLFFAFLWFRVEDIGGDALNGPVTPWLLYSSAFLITWAILRMTRILADRDD